MKLEILAVRDMGAEAYMRPMFLPAVGLGIRAFQDECNRAAGDNAMFNHSQDFYLFHLGSFDDSSGRFTLFDVPLQVASGSQVRHSAGVPATVAGVEGRMQ